MSINHKNHKELYPQNFKKFADLQFVGRIRSDENRTIRIRRNLV